MLQWYEPVEMLKSKEQMWKREEALVSDPRIAFAEPSANAMALLSL